MPIVPAPRVPSPSAARTDGPPLAAPQTTVVCIAVAKSLEDSFVPDLANDDVLGKQEQLIAKVKEKGGHAGNVTLQRELGWEEETYWPIRDRLVDSGLLELGRGRGGSVSLVTQVTQVPPAQPSVSESAGAPSLLTSPQRISESELYDPVAEVLRKQWARDLRFRSHVVEVTARQGRRDTGGTWTRPDIVTAALRVFPHVPGKFFDLITFELKPFDGIDVTAVFEALSHRRALLQIHLEHPVPSANGFFRAAYGVLGMMLVHQAATMGNQADGFLSADATHCKRCDEQRENPFVGHTHCAGADPAAGLYLELSGFSIRFKGSTRGTGFALSIHAV